MRTPIYKTRPVEPHAARRGGHRINEFIVLCEAFSNCYLIQTAEGDIQVNAGMGFEAPVIEDNLRQFSEAQRRYLVLTQGHVDHVGGVGYFRERHPELVVMAQAGNREHQAYDGRLTPFRGQRSAFAFEDKIRGAFDYYAGEGYTDFPPQDAPVPDVLVDDLYTFSLGGLDVELIPVPGAETNDSMILWLPQQRICFTGNLFGCPFGHFPNLVTIRGDRYRDALTCAAAVDLVHGLGARMILYGHHGPVVGEDVIATELRVLRDAILYVHDATVAGMNAGRDVYSLMREIRLPAELEVGEGYGKVSWGVRAIWEGYAGWFQHRSTTELYAQPREVIDADLLALAGGAAPLVARAREKFSVGEPEAALYLLDIVLGELPADRPALELEREVHTQLLAASENFWLSAWLKHRIKHCDQALAVVEGGGNDE